MPIQWIKDRQEQKQHRLLTELAKGDAQTFHDMVDLDIVGMLKEQDIEALANESLKMHRTFTQEEKAVYLPIFKSEVSRLDLNYCTF